MGEQTYRKQLIDLLTEILKWMRFVGKRQLRELLVNLKEDIKKIIYELSDGKSLRDIEKICKHNGYAISRTTIGVYWDK